jgi:hypothetical protein
LLIAAAAAAAAASANADTEKQPMDHEIHGEFDVKMTPSEGAGGAVGHMTLDKTYHGALSATAKGEMLAHRSSTDGSAVYVAIEEVTGMLEGKSGSFVLHHRGVMTRGERSLSVEVAPDSGTGELAGLTGQMSIDIKDGKHFYGFRYKLPH